MLNSRPLNVMSSDPVDLIPLTPSHILLGKTAKDVVDPNLLNLNENRLSVWQHLQYMKQQFWARWSREYFNGVQMRHRRPSNTTALFVGQIVLLLVEASPPLTRPLTRITQQYPGEDGITRVASLDTTVGYTKKGGCKDFPTAVLSMNSSGSSWTTASMNLQLQNIQFDAVRR